MPDLSTGGPRRSLAWRILNGVWFANLLRGLNGGRTGLQALCLGAFINLILFGLFLLCATPIYETNDDLVMQLIASGYYTGCPDAHLVFTNILIGWILRFLYATWAGCNWYLIYILVVHYAALTAIAFVVMSRRFSWLSAWLYVGFALLVEPHILLHLQFTTTAFLAGTAGLLLLVDGMQPRQPLHWPKTLAGVAFVGLMCLVREPVALLMVAVAGPFLLERFGLAGWRRLLGAALASTGLLLLLHGVNHWAYQRDPTWAEFSEYNRLRGEIHDTPLEKFIPQATPAVGWSRNDGWIFSKQFFPDPDVYAGLPRIQLFLAKLRTVAWDEPTSHRTPLMRFLSLPDLFGHDAGILMKLAVLNAIACLFAAGAFRYRCLVTLLISYGFFAVLEAYLFKMARLPERVSYNIPLFINAICLYWAAGFQKRPVAANQPNRTEVSPVPFWRAGILRLLALVLLTIWGARYLAYLSLLAQNLWFANAQNQNLKQISRQILAPIRKLMPAPQKPVLIALPNDSTLEQCLFFYPPAKKAPFYLVPYGWITYSPIYNQILEQHHLHPFLLSLVDRPDIFFLMRYNWEWLQPLTIFYHEHYGLNIRFDPVVNTDEMPRYKECQLYLYQAHIVGDQAPIQAAPR
jgi:hypothetical protein